MKKRITSVLLTLVMLLSLVPAMGTTAFAAGTTNDYLYINREYQLDNGYYITKDAPNAPVAFNGSESSLPSGKTYAALLDNTLYLKGNWDGAVGVIGPNFARRNLTSPLKIVVMGDTTISYLQLYWDYTVKENSGVTIDLRDNATLNITYEGVGRATSAIKALYSKSETSQWLGADVTVKGTGTLKTDVTAQFWNEDPFVKAGAFSITENVNLDTKLAHTGTTDYSFYVYSLSKFVVDTTGYVKIDTSGYADALMLPALVNRYELKNASSITLISSEKKTMFGGVNGGDSDFVQMFIDRCCTGWNVAKSDNNAKPYTLTLTRKAELKDLKLNVGGTPYAKDAVIPDHVVSDDASKKLSVSFDAGPQWFTTYYLKNKVNLNARVYIWKDGVLQSGFNIAQMSFGRTDGTLGFTLDVRNLNLEAGHTYRVYVSVSPTMNGDYLAESPLTAQWTFWTVNAPAKEKISSVSLMQEGYFMTGSSGPVISVKDTLPYEIEGTPTWAQDSSDTNVHTAEVKLKIKDTSKYEFAAGVAASLSTGDSSVTGVVKNDDGTLTVSLKAYQHYQITYKYGDTEVGHELIKAGDTFVLPDKKQPGKPSEDAVFEGWKVDGSDTVYQPGDTYDATADTTFVEKWGVPSTETKPRIFVMTYDELFDEEGHRSYDFTGFSLTVDRQEYVDSNFYNSVPVAIRNLGNGASGQLKVSVVGNDDVSNQVSVGDNGAKETTVDSVASGQFGTFFVTLDRGAGTPAPAPFKAGTVKIKVEDTTNSITKYFLVTINVAPGPYSLYTAAGDATGGSIRSITVTADVENTNDVAPGSVVTVTAPAVAGYAFAGWKALSPVDGTTISEVTFDDEHAATTTFVMPSKNVSVIATYSTDTLESIFVAAPPSKTVYTVGNTFDATGMIVMAKYHSGNTFTLNPSEYTVSSPDMTTDGSKDVTVTYTADNTKTATTTITVLPETPTTYTVSYDANGGSGSMNPGTATQGVSFILPPCAFTPPAGKVFDKWDINGTKYASGASVNISANTTVKADWKDIPAEAVKVAPPTAADPFTYAAGTTHTGVLDSGDSSKYTVTGTQTAINAGTYTAIASLSNSSYYWTDGTQQPKLIEWTINPTARTDKPNAPEMASRTTDSITLKAITAPADETVEYSMDGSYWQSSTTFTGLSSGTGYTFYARYAAKPNYNPSAASDGATFSTLSGGSSSGSTAYTVKVLDSKNGDVTSSHKTAAKGSTVTLTVSPDKGYKFETLTVLDKNGKEIKLTEKNGRYTFIMPASNVEVKATFKAVKSGNPFVDVPSGSYYEDAVIWAVKEGVTGGTSATTFNPNGICTRAQAVTFLWRAAGSPAPKSTTMPFTDVAKGSYYEQAVLWAVENGITKGTSDTTFSPNATCSRAQIVTFLWRSQKSPAAGSVNPFTDVSADAYYADAVLWAVKESVTSGTTATTFSPNANCTRAQIVTFIYRALTE